MNILNVNVYDGGYEFHAYILNVTENFRAEMDTIYSNKLKELYNYDNEKFSSQIREIAVQKHFNGILINVNSEIIYFEIFEDKNE